MNARPAAVLAAMEVDREAAAASRSAMLNCCLRYGEGGIVVTLLQVVRNCACPLSRPLVVVSS